MFGTQVREVLAEAVDREREQRGMTAAGLARQAGVDPDTIRRLLAGKAVRLSTLRQVVLALGVGWEEFLGRLAGSSDGRQSA